MSSSISKVLKDSLVRLSSKDAIPLSDIRIRISRKDNVTKYNIMKKSELLRDLTLKEILNIGFVDVFSKEKLVEEYLKDKLLKLEKEHGIENINVRVFMKNSNDPSLYMFDGTKPIIELTEKDLE